MKKIILCILSVIILISFCSCKSKENEQTADYTFSIDDFEYFSDLFNKPELSREEGEYTIKITGLDTPVIFNMQDMKVLSVTAYDKTENVNIETFQDYCPAHIEGVNGAVIISEDLDFENRCWIFTEDKVYTLFPENSISIRAFSKEDGGIGYRRYWGEYVTSFEQWDTAPLDLCSSRQQLLYEEGYIQIVDGKLFITSQTTVNVEDEYDLDAMFSEAKGNGMYGEYDGVDELFKANAQKKQEG